MSACGSLAATAFYTLSSQLNASLELITDNRAMAHVIAFARGVEFSPIHALRTLIVTGCALSLIMAGQAFPALGL
jgi:hypothetical protein